MDVEGASPFSRSKISLNLRDEKGNRVSRRWKGRRFVLQDDSLQPDYKHFFQLHLLDKRPIAA